MTVTIADLRANVRAEGAEQATQQIRAVGASAQETARALQIMAEQASKSGTFQGGSVAQIMEVFQKGNVQPTAAALAQASQEMGNVAARATQAVAPTRNVAVAAQEVERGFSLTNQTVLRTAGALVGLNLGLSVVAGAARLVHQSISDIVDRQTEWERSLIQIRGLYGNLAPAVAAAAQAQSAAPGVLGSTQEFAQADVAASYLTRRYGLPGTQVRALTSAAGSTAYTLGLDERARADLQARTLQFAESGGTSLREYGIEGDPEAIARRVGLASGAGLQALSPAQIRDVQTTIAAQGLAQFALAGDQQNEGLISIQRTRERALGGARGALASALEGGGAPASSIDQYLAYVGAAGEGAAAPGAAAFGMGQAPAVSANLDQLQKAVEDAQRAVDENSSAIAEHTKQVQDAEAHLRSLGVEVGSVTAHLLTFTGSIEDSLSIARGDVGAQAQSAVTGRMRTAFPTIGTPGSEIRATGTAQAYADAYQNYIASRAQQEQENANRDFLERQASQQGPGLEPQRAAARRALEEASQAAPLQQQMGELRVTAAQQELAIGERQAQLDRIRTEQSDRQLRMIRETVDLRTLDLNQQRQILTASQDVTRAQQAALPAQFRLSDAQFQVTQSSALAQQRMARLLRGQDVSGLPTINQLINQNVQGQLDVAEDAPAALQAQRRVELAQRTATAAGLAQQLTAGQLQDQQLRVDLQNLGDLPQQTALELELNQINRDSLGIQTEQRELLKAILAIMQAGPAGDQNIVTSAQDPAALIFGSGNNGAPASSHLGGARRLPQ